MPSPNTYEVFLEERVIYKAVIEAESEDQAVEIANEDFNVFDHHDTQTVRLDVFTPESTDV